MVRAKHTLALVALAVVGCSNQVLPASTPTSNAVLIQLNTTTSTLPLITELTRRYAQINPGVSFEVSAGNYASAELEVSSATPVYFLTNHLPPPEESALWGAPIGQDGIAIITHPGINVDNLTTEELRAIYQGRIINWQTVSGSPQAITVISRETGSGTRAEFERLLMGDRQTTQLARIAPTSAAVVLSVARQPGSIGYVSMSYLDPTVQPLKIDGIAPTITTVYDNEYPLRTTLFFAGPEEPTDEHLRSFIAWVQSPEGQIIVGQRYTPLLRP